MEPLPKVSRNGGGLELANAHWTASLADGALRLGKASIAPVVILAQDGREIEVEARELDVVIEDDALARIVASGTSGEGHSLRITYDLHQTENLHVYVRLELAEAALIEAVELPRLHLDGLRQLEALAGSASLGENGEMPLLEPWLQLRGDEIVGVGITKFPWFARWNDVGATGYHTLGNAKLHMADGHLGLHADGPLDAAPSDTIEAAFLLRPLAEPIENLRFQTTHNDSREIVYIPAIEWEQFLSRQVEDRWLGPPIQGGCQNRPVDQLIPRSLGMDILAQRRFSWNNEDTSLWRLTGKSIYRDIAVKKSYGLLAGQNEYGGWFEGIEFYNLPPRHHQHYHSYTAFVYLIDAFDVTGNRPFLDAALRSKEFWFGDPPANSHSVDAADAWWYRWGGYINDAGYTDERHALNTHASVLLIFSLLWTRLQDEEAKRGLDYGMNAFKLALDKGLQRSNGQFLYMLAQADPRLELPGDPPYVRTDLIPQIDDVYNVLSAFRLIVANRVLQDPVVSESCERALSYFWAAHRAGTAYTYRSYTVKTFALGAGELDLRFAFSLPYFLSDPDNWTSIYKGFSAWVAPLNQKGLLVEPQGQPPGLESVFLSRNDDAFTFAVANVGAPRTRIPISVELDERARGSEVELVEPADGSRIAKLPSSETDGRIEFELPALSENAVAVVGLLADSHA